MRLVMVEWEDSFGCSANWSSLDVEAPKPMICKSVGWLLHDGDACKVIVPHVAEEVPGASRQGCGDMTIPVRSIVRIVDLSEAA